MLAKLIFNPGSGATGDSPMQLMNVIRAMQAWKLALDAYLVEPGCNLPAVIHKAIEDGIRLTSTSCPILRQTRCAWRLACAFQEFAS